MSSQMYTYVKTYHIAYFKSIQGLECQSYVNKYALKTIKPYFLITPPKCYIEVYKKNEIYAIEL